MHDERIAALDQEIAPGLRLWMLIGLVGGVLLVMIVIVCCFIRIRIPRTKRQIELIAAQRKMRSAQKIRDAEKVNDGLMQDQEDHHRSRAIVLNSAAVQSAYTKRSLPRKEHISKSEVV